MKILDFVLFWIIHSTDQKVEQDKPQFMMVKFQNIMRDFERPALVSRVLILTIKHTRFPDHVFNFDLENHSQTNRRALAIPTDHTRKMADANDNRYLYAVVSLLNCCHVQKTARNVTKTNNL